MLKIYFFGPSVRMLVLRVVGVWLGCVVLASSPPPYGKVPRPILKKTNRLTQAVVFSRRHFLWVYLPMYNGNVQQNPLCAASCVTKDLPTISPRFSPTFFHRDENSVLIQAHLCTVVGSTVCAKPCVRNCSSGEREGLYLNMYYGNVQQNPLCAASCVT